MARIPSPSRAANHALLSISPPNRLEGSFAQLKVLVNLPKLPRHEEQSARMFIYFTRIFEKISSLEDGDNFNVTNLETCLKDTTNQYTALTDARPSDDELYSIKQFHPHQHAISEMLSHFSETVYTCTEALPDIRQAGAEAWKADDVACKVDQDSMDGHLRRLVQTRGAVTELFGLSEERTKEQARGMEIWLKQASLDSARSSSERTLFGTGLNILILKQDWFQVLFPGQIRSVVAGYLEPVADAIYQDLRTKSLLDINIWSQLDINSMAQRVIAYIDVKKDPSVIKGFQESLAANGVHIVEVNS